MLATGVVSLSLGVANVLLLVLAGTVIYSVSGINGPVVDRFVVVAGNTGLCVRVGTRVCSLSGVH